MIKYSVLRRNEDQNLASIHLEAFHGFFLSSLGKGFLKAYYKAALNSVKTIAVCATDEKGQILGFGTGGVQSKGYHKQLILHNLVTFMYQGVILLFKNPKALMRLAMNLDKISSDNDDGNYGELISIGITDTFQGLGVGRNLIKLFEDEARRRGCTRITLTADYYNNEDVVAFYMHSGYHVLYEFDTYPQRRMYKLIKNLD